MFLIQCISKDSLLDSFDEIREEMFYKSSLKLDIEKFPSISDSIRLHILCAYFQAHLWYHAVYANTQINPLEYGYEEDGYGYLCPIFINKTNILPDDFPVPCTCKKCARETACKCRKMQIPCCTYCGCQAKRECSNPYD